jgi:DNA-binding IclR family transcriptional regulator
VIEARENRDSSEERDHDGGGGYTVQAIDSAISLLMLIADHPDLGLSELARRLGAGKARIYRQLKTLEERGLVSCSEPGRTWRLGLATLMLGAKASRQMDLVTVARPFLAQLGEQLQETVQLRIVDGDETVCIARWEPARDLRVHAPIGRRRPLHAGSSKVILAYMNEAEQNRILTLPRQRFTPRTLLDSEQIRSVLTRIRQDGFGISRGEVNTDLVSVSAPVFRLGGLIAGALNIAAPASRMDDASIERATSLVVATAAELTSALGGEWPHRPADSGNTLR